jgi:hypothetical protein
MCNPHARHWVMLLGLFVAAIGHPGALSAEMPAAIRDLSFLPKGLVLGMSVEDLLRERPAAKELTFGFEEKPTPGPDDLAKGDHALLEEFKANADFEVAVYAVRGGRVVAFSMEGEWTLSKELAEADLLSNLSNVGTYGKACHAAAARLAERRDRILGECRGRLGEEFVIEAVWMSAGKQVRYLAPRFRWEKGGACLSFLGPSDYQDVEIAEGSVKVFVWKADDPIETRTAHLEPAEDVPKEVITRLAAPLLKKGKTTNVP